MAQFVSKGCLKRREQSFRKSNNLTENKIISRKIGYSPGRILGKCGHLNRFEYALLGCYFLFFRRVFVLFGKFFMFLINKRNTHRRVKK